MYNDVQPSNAELNAIVPLLNELYPGHVLQGKTIPLLNVNPGISADDLLDLIKDRFGGPIISRLVFFLGVFPGNQGPFAANSRGGFGLGGLSHVGDLGAWAQAGDPVAAAHELAHNIGFDHWACQFGAQAADECRVFPIANGGTGVFGTNINAGTVLPPGDNSGMCTPHAHDFQSYGRVCNSTCSPLGFVGCNTGEWVSWYTYDILLHNTLIDSYDTDDPPAMLVSGHIRESGGLTSAELRPVYHLNMTSPIVDTIPEEEGEDIWTIQGYDSTGNTLFVHNFEPKKLSVHSDDYDHVFRFDEAVPLIAGTRSVEVFRNADSIGFMAATSDQVPSVRITAPT